MARGKQHVDWGSYIKTFGAMAVGLVGLAITFYFSTKSFEESTKSVLTKHEAQFIEVGRKFEGFNDTLKKNYDDWARQNKVDQEKAEAQRKADQEKSEAMRQKFLDSFNVFGVQSAETKVQVNNIAKQLDAVTSKLDMIQDVQRQDTRSRPAGSTTGR